MGVAYGNREVTYPVMEVERWVSLSRRIGDELLFCRIDRYGNLKEGGLSGKAINDLVKKRVESAGLDPSRCSGHYLCTELPASASETMVWMKAWISYTCHKLVAVAIRYARRGTLFTNNPAAQVGL